MTNRFSSGETAKSLPGCKAVLLIFRNFEMSIECRLSSVVMLGPDKLLLTTEFGLQTRAQNVKAPLPRGFCLPAGMFTYPQALHLLF